MLPRDPDLFLPTGIGVGQSRQANRIDQSVIDDIRMCYLILGSKVCRVDRISAERHLIAALTPREIENALPDLPNRGVVSSTADESVRPEPTDEPVIARFTIETVVARSPREEVIAVATDEGIDAVAADERVIAGLARGEVYAGADVDRIVPSASVDLVIAADLRILGIVTKELIPAGGPPDLVAPCPTKERVLRVFFLRGILI